MAVTSPKKLTRLDREAASEAAAPFDLAPAARIAIVVLPVVVLAFVVSIVVPGGGSLGGPLQDANVAAGATFSTVRRAGDGVVTIGVFVPWNPSGSTAVLEEIVPVAAEGVEVVKSGVAAPGQTSIAPVRGFPPDGLVLFPVEGSIVAPGAGPLDGAQIAVGLRGEGSVLAFVLTYRVGNERFHSLLTNGAMLCRGPCEGKADAIERQRDLAGALSAFLDVSGR